ncbi:MAG: mannose-1-phosphate guanylyltransferase [Candidatus Shapirobacteria bacterium]|jgi:mannose-1-phosphate guanylyltransferase
MQLPVTPNDIYILILCGGSGPRLWPLSRADSPKQFLKLFGPKSILEQTISRSRKITRKENIYLITNHKYLDKVLKETAGKVLPKNILSEPTKKNTTMALIYGTIAIKNINPNAIITSFPSDHLILDTNLFKTTILSAAKLAKNTNSIVAIGTKPTNPNPSYGYLIPKEQKKGVFTVSKFVEKPDFVQAQKLISQDAYWNSGIYTFSAETFVSEIAKNQPGYFKILNLIENNLHHKKIITKAYQLSENLSFDIAISEKTKNLLMLLATFDWSDIGEWGSIHNRLKKDQDDISILNKKTQTISHNSKNCLVSGLDKKLIGLVGVKNLAIIDTPDALLICSLQNSSNVRDLVGKIVKSNKTISYFLTKSYND